MIPAWSYDQICKELGRAFQKRYPHRERGSIRMVGLLFAPPGARLAREHIIPSLDYFHHRSGDNIDFFCAGYSRYGFTPGERPVSNDDPPWMFSDQVFEFAP